MELITPPTLRAGDTIALVSPSSAVDPALITGAEARLRAEGFNVEVMPHAAESYGSYAAATCDRLDDLQKAVDNPSVGAIICTRGGYGAVHLLDKLRVHRPVWLAGFSDISALHALWLSNGFRSIHSSMAKELTLSRCAGDEANRRLLDILRTGHMPEISFAPQSPSKPGRAVGRLVGGNLAVLNGLAGTRLDLLCGDTLLVLEDVAEPIYKVERVFWRLRLSGVLAKLRGLIVGQFNAYKPSDDYADMYSMLAQFVNDIPGPVAFGAPIGHVDANLPFIEGADAELMVEAGHASIVECQISVKN